MRIWIVGIIACFSAQVSAQSQVAPIPFVEALPDNVERRILADEVRSSFQLGSSRGQISEQFIQRGNMWSPGQSLRVCFFGGSKRSRSAIANIAMKWTPPSAPIRLDFGDMNDPRICGNGLSHIRVGYNERGYWSLVGRDSIVYADQYSQSMNLQGFDVLPTDNLEFQSVVLHEFGHALGFQHEHQAPISSCSEEFNWSYIYAYLGGPPNYWDTEKVDRNLRKLAYYSGDFAAAFDRKSIMLYTFPETFYLSGRQSSCYSSGNFDLSEGDRAALTSAYAGRADGLSALADFVATLGPDQRDAARNRLMFLQLENNSALVLSEQLQTVSSTTFQKAVKALPKEGVSDNALATFGQVKAVSSER